jgi:hypothetical protein
MRQIKFLSQEISSSLKKKKELKIVSKIYLDSTAVVSSNSYYIQVVGNFLLLLHSYQCH